MRGCVGAVSIVVNAVNCRSGKAGVVHGGVIASLIDTVVVGPLMSALDAPTRKLPTIDLHVHYFDATYVVTLVLDGEAGTFTCASTDEGGGWVVREVVGAADVEYCTGQGFMLRGMPESAEITVDAQDGSWNGSRSTSPIYQSTEPNGPDCPPISIVVQAHSQFKVVSAPEHATSLLCPHTSGRMRVKNGDYDFPRAW